MTNQYNLYLYIYIVIHEGITNSTGQFLWIAPLTLGMAKDDSPLNDWMRGIWNIIVVIIIGVNCCVKPVSRCELYPNDSSQYLLIVYHFHTPHISTNYHLCQCFCAKTMESHKKKLGPLFSPFTCCTEGSPESSLRSSYSKSLANFTK